MPLAGKIMLNLSWVALLGLLTLFFAHQQAKRQNPNQELSSVRRDGYNEITLKRNPQYHYLANGFINGKEVTFLIDTGASDVAVPASLARQLKLTPGESGFMHTANGTVEVRRTQIDKLQLGSIELRNVDASINPGMQGDEVLLGMTFLRHLEFSQKNGELTIKQSN